MTKQIIGLDVDGVIADYFTPLLIHINQLLGTSHRYEDCISHNLAESFGISVEEMRKLLIDFETDELIASLPPLEGALEAIALLQTKYDIAIITSRRTEWQAATAAWLDQYFSAVQVYYTIGRNNTFAGGPNRLHKPQVAEQIGAFCLIEDNEQEFYHWDSDKVEPICFAQPWNRGLIATHPHIPRLRWPEIISRLMS